MEGGTYSPLHEIGRVFGKDHVSIQFMLAQHGGIAPAALGGSSPRTLALAEREEISRGDCVGWVGIREIAKDLKRAVSTVSRGRLPAMAGDLCIEPVTLAVDQKAGGVRPCGPSGCLLCPACEAAKRSICR